MKCKARTAEEFKIMEFIKSTFVEGKVEWRYLDADRILITDYTGDTLEMTVGEVLAELKVRKRYEALNHS